MGTTLTGTTPQDTYDSLIKVTDNGPLSGTAKYLSDGLGNDSALALSTGNIGIGTTTPNRNLHILGSAGIGTVLKLEAGSGAVTYLQLAYNGATNAQSGYIGYDSSANMGLFTNDTERVRITGAGNVGIGTSTPTAQGANITSLDVAGSAGASLTTRGSTVTGEVFALDSAGGLYISTKTNHPMIFRTNDVERMRLTNNGLTFNGDTAAANALDDYEEGTWTMGVTFTGGSTGITYNANSGNYVKIGRQVTVTGYIEMTSKGTDTGTARITGLPFTIATGSSHYSKANLWINKISFANALDSYGVVNTTTIELGEVTEAGVFSTLNDTNFANNSEIMLSFTYFV